MKIKYFGIGLALVLVVGLLLPKTSFAEAIGNAAANVAAKVAHVIVDNWPELFNTREQNVDANGNIKVAQQGTMDVNVVSSQLQPKIVTLFEDHVFIPGGENITSEAVNIEGYKKIGLYVSRPEGNYSMYASWQFSLDGQKWFTSLQEPTMELYLTNNRFAVIDVAGPFVRAKIENWNPPSPSVSAYFYLIP